MKQTANPAKMLQFITQPAFLVKGGVVTETNDAAAAFHISNGTPILEMIICGKEDYEAFSSGKLYLSLTCGRAWVSVCDEFHLVCLEETFSSPELRAFALAAQHLRAPLSNAVSGTELIMQRVDLEGTELKQQLSQVNKNLYQLIRTVCNMSDVSQLGITSKANTHLCKAGYILGEIFEKAETLSGKAKRSIRFRNLKQDVECLLDVSLIERAILNMLSNAIKFSPEDSVVNAVLKQSGDRLTLTLENRIKNGYTGVYGNAFNRFLREPGIESGQMGIGLGMSIISRAVSAHDGSILMNLTQKGIVKVSLSIPIRTVTEPTAKSPVILLEGYTGGIDNYLVELSDILPKELYENI